MYSWLITRTDAADSRIATLAKRAKLSSMNMPLKATVVAVPRVPIQTARPSIRIPVAQTMAGAVLSLPVYTAPTSASIAKAASTISGRMTFRSAWIMLRLP